jgi:hypothetical protein
MNRFLQRVLSIMMSPMTFWFIIIAIMVSCRTVMSEEDCTSYDFSGCHTAIPFEGNLNIKATINDENPRVVLYIYKGKFEAGNLIMTDTTSSEKYSLSVELDNFYTVMATYHSSGNSIRAIGGDDVKKTSENVCDSTCWSVHYGNVDVRLKY